MQVRVIAGATRFILTMWYVNQVNVGGTVRTLYRFILTMWYVNSN